MMESKYVKELALLGVDRRKIDDGQIPDAIRSKLKSNANTESGQRDAAKLLDIITYNSFYQLRGVGPARVEGYDIERINETKSYCGKTVMDVYSEIVSQDYHVRNDLLKGWVSKVDQRGELVTAEKVLDLIDAGVALDKKSKKSITNIVGNRGRYILSFYKSENYEITQLSDDVWTQGSINERKAYYIEKRKENISEVNKLLHNTWKSEGHREQLAFLKIMSVGLATADLPFLEEIYTTEYEGELINKKGPLNSKLLICSMLARLDYEPVLSAVQSGLADYVHQVKAVGILNNIMAKKTKVILLPQTQDDFWDGDYLNRLMGFDSKNMNIKLFDFDPYYWMNSFVSILPFSFWSSILDKTLEDVVKYLLLDPGFKSRVSGQDVAIFQDAMIFNAVATNDSNLADAISFTIHNEDVYLLAPLMSQPAFEKYVMDNRLRTELSLFESRSTDDQWSVSFSKNMVSELFNMCKSGRFIPNVKFGRVMARYFHKDAFGHLASVSKAQEGTQWYNAWLTNVLEPIRQSILIRQRINTL